MKNEVTTKQHPLFRDYMIAVNALMQLSNGDFSISVEVLRHVRQRLLRSAKDDETRRLIESLFSDDAISEAGFLPAGETIAAQAANAFKALLEAADRRKRQQPIIQGKGYIPRKGVRQAQVVEIKGGRKFSAPPASPVAQPVRAGTTPRRSGTLSLSVNAPASPAALAQAVQERQSPWGFDDKPKRGSSHGAWEIIDFD